MASSGFFWNCPLLTCEEEFRTAKARLEHLEQVHWTDTNSSGNYSLFPIISQLTLSDSMHSGDFKSKERDLGALRPAQSLKLCPWGDFMVILGSEDIGQLN